MRNQTKTIQKREGSSRHWRPISSSRKVSKSKLSNLRFLLFWFLFQYPFLKTNFHHFFPLIPAWNPWKFSKDDEQVSAMKNVSRASYVHHKYPYPSYLILKPKWSPILIHDSCRFLAHKDQIFILEWRRISVGFGCSLKLLQVFLISSSSSAKYKLIQDLLVSCFLIYCD